MIVPTAVLIDHVQAASAAKMIALSVTQCYLSLVALKDLERTGRLLLVAGSAVVPGWERDRRVGVAPVEGDVGGGAGRRSGMVGASCRPDPVPLFDERRGP